MAKRKSDSVGPQMPVDPSALESAIWWHNFSGRWLLLVGLLTTAAACAMLVFTVMQWRANSLLKRHSEWRMAGFEKETADAKRETAAAQERVAELQKETAKLGKDVAEANKLTAQAEGELIKYRAARSLTNEQAQLLTEATSPFKGLRVSIAPLPETFESISFTDQVIRALAAADINVSRNPVVVRNHLGNARGVVVMHVTGNPRGEEFSTAVVRTLSNAGFLASSVGGFLESTIKDDDDRTSSERSRVLLAVGEKF